MYSSNGVMVLAISPLTARCAEYTDTDTVHPEMFAVPALHV